MGLRSTNSSYSSPRCNALSSGTRPAQEMFTFRQQLLRNLGGLHWWVMVSNDLLISTHIYIYIIIYMSLSNRTSTLTWFFHGTVTSLWIDMARFSSALIDLPRLLIGTLMACWRLLMTVICPRLGVAWNYMIWAAQFCLFNIWTCNNKYGSSTEEIHKNIFK